MNRYLKTILTEQSEHTIFQHTNTKTILIPAKIQKKNKKKYTVPVPPLPTVVQRIYIIILLLVHVDITHHE